MRPISSQNLLSAAHGSNRVTIGLDSADALRRLSDQRALTCPGCGAIVILHAGVVRAHHFAHLPGAVCSLPQTEPETEEHRAGKLLLAQWLRIRLPQASVIVEAYLPETGQRADLLIELPDDPPGPRRIAVEFQCANLAAREWKRRRRLYRDAGVSDLWLLGGSRMISTRESAPSSAHAEGPHFVLRTTELERALLAEGAPLLFLDVTGEHLHAGTLARFRPAAEAQILHPRGRLSARPLLELEFPWPLLERSAEAPPDLLQPDAPAPAGAADPPRPIVTSEAWLWEWLAQRHRVTRETLPAFFGVTVFGQEALACEPRAWQAALYYRFVHRQIGGAWWLVEALAWARNYLPLTRPANEGRLKAAVAEYQEILAAAGMLSLPIGYGRRNARVLADLTTLAAPPDREEVLRLARYRRTLSREARADYKAR